MIERFIIAALFTISTCLFGVEESENKPNLSFQSSTEDQFIKLDWAMSAPSYSIGEPVFATLTITNKSTVKLFMPYSTPNQLSNPSIFQNDKAVPLTAFGNRDRLEGISHISLKLPPGKSASQLIFLSRAYDLSLAGTFRAYAEVHYSDEQTKSSTTLKANPIQFQIEDLPDGEILAPKPKEKTTTR